MGKIEIYRTHLQQMCDWESFLLAESRLRGSQANVELARAAAEEGDAAQFYCWLALGPEVAPAGTPAEFLAYCGVLGLARLLASGDATVLADMRAAAEDPRLIIREAAANALCQSEGRDASGMANGTEDKNSVLNMSELSI